MTQLCTGLFETLLDRIGAIQADLAQSPLDRRIDARNRAHAIR